MQKNGVDFEVGIIGGGPAGATTAAYLAQAGIDCAVFERSFFPRPHVGESLVPSTMRIFGELGFIEQMEEAKFPRKYGAIWTTDEKQPVYRHDWDELLKKGDTVNSTPYVGVSFEERKQPGVDRDYTYHVDRAKFDLMMLQHAHKLGAKVFQGASISTVDFSDPDKVQLGFGVGKKTMKVDCRMIVDASGRNTFLGSRLDLKVKDQHFDQCAVHTWFENYDRGWLSQAAREKDYIFVHFLPVRNTWIWAIPITDTITSVGVVSQKANFRDLGNDPEKVFWEFVGTRPDFCKALKASRQMRPFSTEGDYSYAMTQICGDRYVLVGDAGRFVDPIFSSGVSIAMTGARFASLDIIEAAKTGNYSKDAFQGFESTIRRGTKNWYRFITMYYRLNVLFTYFVKDKRYRLDILKLLQGDLYDDNPEVLDVMERMVSEVEMDPSHPWHSVLGNLTCKAFSPTF
jgi:flavin-dependent dehydrogenase